MIVARSSAPSWGRCNADVRTVAPTRSQKKTPQESKKSDNKSGFVIEYGAIMELCVPVPSSVPRMRRLAPRVAASVHRCQPASSDPRRSDVKDGFPGELRVQLCRCKNNGFTGGTIPVANAGVWFTYVFAYVPRPPGVGALTCDAVSIRGPAPLARDICEEYCTVHSA